MIIRNGLVVTPYEICRCDVRVQDGIIAALGHFSDTDKPVIDADGCYVCPGFVDIHTHGGGGGDFMDATEDAFRAALQFHTRNGTTALLATSVTAPVEKIQQMLSSVRQHLHHDNGLCRILGAHVEGPYLSLKNKGAQHEAYLRIPSRDDYSFLLENSDVIKTVTIAPELEGAVEMTRALRAKGILVCGGHDDGEKDLIMPVIDAGLRHCTHLWCAMSTVAMRNGVRNVGLCELGLVDSRLTVELIADNHHITPDMVKLVYRCKGADAMCVVSDCLRAGGMPRDGKLYTLGALDDETAQKFIVSDGVARLPDGSRYAGSIQPVSQMVRNLICDCNIPLVDAVKIGSLTPAKIVGADAQIGSITVGKRADLCLLDPQYHVTKTLIAGKETAL